MMPRLGRSLGFLEFIVCHRYGMGAKDSKGGAAKPMGGKHTEEQRSSNG